MDLGLPLAEILPLIAALLAGGFAMGILAGLFGVGGGGILVPVLFEVYGFLGIDEAIRLQLAVGTSLLVVLATSIRSFQAHYAHGAVDMGLVKSCAVAVVLGSALAAIVARFADVNVFKGIWSVVPTLVALKFFFGRDDWKIGDEIPGQPFRAIFGLVVGLISTLMSIGGGAFVTALMTLYGRTIHHAVATASAFGPMIALPGTLGFMWAGWHAAGLPPASLGFVNLLGAAIIIPASVLAAPLGVRLAHGIPRRKLEIAFAIFLSFIAFRFFVSLVL
jgi:uncharacterized membrane protein YfcA